MQCDPGVQLTSKISLHLSALIWSLLGGWPLSQAYSFLMVTVWLPVALGPHPNGSTKGTSPS